MIRGAGKLLGQEQRKMLLHKWHTFTGLSKDSLH